MSESFKLCHSKWSDFRCASFVAPRLCFTRPGYSYNKDPLSRHVPFPTPHSSPTYSLSFNLNLVRFSVERACPLLPVHLFHHALAQRSSQLPRILPTLGQVGNPSPSHTTSTTTTRQAGVPPLLLLFHLHSSSHCLLPITTCSNLYITANQNAGVFPIHHRWCRGPY